MTALLVQPSRSYVVTSPGRPTRRASIENRAPSHPKPTAKNPGPSPPHPSGELRHRGGPVGALVLVGGGVGGRIGRARAGRLRGRWGTHRSPLSGGEVVAGPREAASGDVDRAPAAGSGFERGAAHPEQGRAGVPRRLVPDVGHPGGALGRGHRQPGDGGGQDRPHGELRTDRVAAGEVVRHRVFAPGCGSGAGDVGGDGFGDPVEEAGAAGDGQVGQSSGREGRAAHDHAVVGKRRSGRDDQGSSEGSGDSPACSAHESSPAGNSSRIFRSLRRIFGLRAGFERLDAGRSPPLTYIGGYDPLT